MSLKTFRSHPDEQFINEALFTCPFIINLFSMPVNVINQAANPTYINRSEILLRKDSCKLELVLALPQCTCQAEKPYSNIRSCR